jgi:hypothetical protein
MRLRRNTPLQAGTARGLALFVMVAVVLRFAVPAGAMIAPPSDAQAGPRIVLCTSAGMIEIAAADRFGVPASDDDGAPKESRKAEPCAFAGLTAPIGHPPPEVADAPRAAFTVPKVRMAAWQRPGLGLVAPPPPSTGPPAPL